MKVTVIGGGSTYTPELVKGFLDRTASFPVTELWLMDIDAGRLEVVGGLTRRIAAAAGNPFSVHTTLNQREAVAGARYVITQLRVGMMQARRNDEYLGRRHQLIGQETTGVGGMAKALRTIPVILQIARDMRELAPGALLVNFTNPSGLITEALLRHAPDVTTVGVCNVAYNARMSLLGLLEAQTGEQIAPERTQLKTLGLNHLTWHSGFLVDGRDRWPEVLPGLLQTLRQEEQPEWNPELIEALGMLPNYYLEYYYETQQRLEQQAQWPPSRAEEVMEIEQRLLQQYAEPERTSAPEDLMKRGGAYYSTVATQLLNAHHNNLGEIHVVNTRHAGAVPGWPADWVLEMPCRIDRAGIHPLPAEPLPPACAGLVAQVKAYELLTIQAAIHGDRRAAYLALLAHPLGPAASQVQAVLNDLLETNRPYLPQFFVQSEHD